jgi:hypothetical protein
MLSSAVPLFPRKTVTARPLHRFYFSINRYVRMAMHGAGPRTFLLFRINVNVALLHFKTHFNSYIMQLKFWKFKFEATSVITILLIMFHDRTSHRLIADLLSRLPAFFAFPPGRRYELCGIY